MYISLTRRWIVLRAALPLLAVAVSAADGFQGSPRSTSTPDYQGTGR